MSTRMLWSADSDWNTVYCLFVGHRSVGFQTVFCSWDWEEWTRYRSFGLTDLFLQTIWGKKWYETDQWGVCVDGWVVSVQGAEVLSWYWSTSLNSPFEPPASSCNLIIHHLNMIYTYIKKHHTHTLKVNMHICFLGSVLWRWMGLLLEAAVSWLWGLDFEKLNFI